MSDLYGPSNPAVQQNYDNFRKRDYLNGYAAKIRYDLGRLLGIYSGIRALVFKIEIGDRCPTCTDLLTGERFLTSCPDCLGTGYMNKYTSLGETWIGINIGPAQNIATDTGVTQNAGTKRDVISIVGLQQLHDRDLVILKDARLVYKIEDIEPEIVGLGGNILIQNVQATLLEPGHVSYKLISW